MQRTGAARQRLVAPADLVVRPRAHPALRVPIAVACRSEFGRIPVELPVQCHCCRFPGMVCSGSKARPTEARGKFLPAFAGYSKKQHLHPSNDNNNLKAQAPI